ncbi:MAG: PrsW family intramembrane metalloprotease [Erysipelotrichaceae bacterium]|nr:PrsW family intramembrane metalloprotease [Erysipelotrichaceae bacterium]
MNNLLKKFQHKILIALTAYLIFTGFYLIFEGLYKDNPNTDKFPLFLTCLSVLVFYIVPFYFGLKYLIKRFNVSIEAVYLSIILGITATTYLSSEGNSLLSMIWLSIDPTRQFLNDWGAALTAPFAEEFSKGFIVLLVFWLCKKMSLKAAFVCGLIAGLGFQMFEDVLYIHNAVFFGDISGFAEGLERVAAAFGTHAIFTAMFGCGLMVLVKKSTAISKYHAIFWMITSLAIHFVWNSPIEWDGKTFMLGSFGLFMACYIFTVVDKLNDNDQIDESKLADTTL